MSSIYDLVEKEAPLTEKQLMAVELALMGMSDREIAKKIRVNRQRVGIWRREHGGFQAALEKGRQEIRIRCRERLARMMEEALEKVTKAMRSEDERVSLQAALAVLRLSGIQGSAKPPAPPTEKELVQIALAWVSQEQGWDKLEPGVQLKRSMEKS